MDMIALTPSPPYYAVIFTSLLSSDHEGYEAMAGKMLELARQQDGFLGVESVSNGLGITVSYWADEISIRRWKMDTDHLLAQKYGREKWYSAYKTRVCKVERDYGFSE